MPQLTDSTMLLDDHEALRDRFDADGYLYLRGVIDPAPLLEVRRDITEICRSHRWLREDTDPIDAVQRVEPRIEGEDRFFDVYDDLQKLESFHSVPHHPSVQRCLTPLLGDDFFPHPLGIARLTFPDEEWATPPHQDFPNNQGTTELYACWMPLGDCPESSGPLSILRGSHRLGLLPLQASLGAGHRRAKLRPEHDELDWVSGDLRLGDALVFHSLTLHRALPNRSDRLRLSVDYRFQRSGDALTEGCLKPHFDRVSWEDVYAGWVHDHLKYYWHDHRYEVVPWNPDLFAVPEDEFEDQIREFVMWRRKHPAVD